MTKPLTARQAAKALDISRQRLSVLLNAGRVIGAWRDDRLPNAPWQIPAPVMVEAADYHAGARPTFETVD